MGPSLAEHVDRWYADMAGSPVEDEIVQRHPGLPSSHEEGVSSLPHFDGLRRVLATAPASVGAGSGSAPALRP